MTNNRDYACFLSGLSAGMALALVFAPRTRGELKDDVRGKLRHGQDLLREGKEAIEREKDKITAAIDAGKRAYRESA